VVHGYHLIWGTYGFWLPNDPRGSWSDFVGSWELARFGRAISAINPPKIDTSKWDAWRTAATKALRHKPVRLDGRQARAVGRGFAVAVGKCRLAVWACSIMPEHVHLVVARHRYKAEQICNLLKGEATKQLKTEAIHPRRNQQIHNGKLPSPWEVGQWKVYLDSEAAIEAAIHYVEDNPVKEGKPPQKWSFVTPFAGLDRSGWTTYY
jgi:REP element-mobilizing transposase RayT